MKLKALFKFLQRTQALQTSWVQPTLLGLALMGSGALVGCSGGAGNKELAEGNIGARLKIVAGNNQIANANQLYKSVLKIRVTDSLLGTPISNAKVQFIQTSGPAVVILVPVAYTDEQGFAATQVQAPTSYGQAAIIEAQLVTTATKAIFTLSTEQTGSGAKYTLSSTNTVTVGNAVPTVLTETAGQTFEFFVYVRDEQDNIVSTVNETRLLQWSFQATDSWAGQSPQLFLDKSTWSCAFVNGVCRTGYALNEAISSAFGATGSRYYQFTDAHNTTKVWVGDGPAGLNDVFAKPLVITKQAPSAVYIADKVGGPDGIDGAYGSTDGTASPAQIAQAADNSTAMQPNFPKKDPLTPLIVPLNSLFSTDDPTKNFYGVAVDAAGNFCRDLVAGDNVVWTPGGSDPVVAYFGATPTSGNPTGPMVQYNPSKNGAATFIVSATGLTTLNRPILVDTGAPAKIALPSVPTSMFAGNYFYIQMKVTDTKGNVITRHADDTGDFSGLFTVKYDWLEGEDQNPIVSKGCSQLGPSISASCNTYTTTFSFNSGVALYTTAALLNDATYGVPLGSPPGTPARGKPRLKVHIDPTTAFPGPTGTGLDVTSPVIDVLVGPPDHLMLYATNTDTNYAYCSAYQLVLDPTGAACLSYPSGTTPIDYYLKIEDRGGNVLGDPTPPFTINGTNAWLNSWSYVSGNRVRFSPDLAGSGGIAISSGGVSFSKSGLTLTGILHHYRISVQDDLGDFLNVLDARGHYKLIVEGLDSKNNLVAPGMRSLTIGYNFGSNPSASYKGTAAVKPPAAPTNYTFIAGKVEIPNLVLANSSSPVTITVTDSTGDALVIIPGNLTPNLKAGPPAELKIQTNVGATAATGGAAGNQDYTNTPVTINTDSSQIYYLSVYDSELNYINTVVQGNWSFVNWTGGTTQPILSGNPNQNVTLNPWSTGSGKLQATFNPGSGPLLMAQTGIYTIQAGTLSSLGVIAQNGATQRAGSPFSVTVRLHDSKSNVLNYNGTQSVVIAVTSDSPTSANFTGTGPISGTYNFTNGVLTDAAHGNFTLYNSAATPRITYTIGSTFGYIDMSGMYNDNFSRFAVKAATTGMNAGTADTYTILALDAWGNTQTTNRGDGGPTLPVEFDFTSALGGQNITSATGFTSQVPATISGTVSSIHGNLTNGQASFGVTATQSGYMNGLARAFPVAAPAPAANTDTITVNALTTISSVVWSPAPQPTYVASTNVPVTTFGVKILDSFGNPVTNPQPSVTASLTTTSGGPGSPFPNLSSDYTNIGFNNGIASFYGLTTSRIEDYSLGATLSSGGLAPPASPFSVVLGNATQTYVKLPGQTFTSNIGTPITGTPTVQAVNVPFNVTVYATDSSNNLQTTYSGPVTLASNNDSYALISPASTNFVNGVVTFSVTNRKAGGAGNPNVAANRTLTANGLGTNITSTGYGVTTGSLSQLIVLLPGQNLSPGASTLAAASAGSPTAQTAGVSTFPARVYGVDSYFNVVNNNAATVTLASTDPYATFNGSTTSPTLTLTNGLATFSIVNYKANFTEAPAYTASALTPASPSLGGTVTNNVSTNYTVNPGAASRTILVSTGQTYTPGAATYAAAVTWTNNAIKYQTAGTPFSSVLRVVDAYYNTVVSYSSSESASLTTSDPNDVNPVSQNFASGKITFNATNITSDATGALASTLIPVFSASTNSLLHDTPLAYEVKPGAGYMAIVVLPGQTYLHGKNPNANPVTAGAITGTPTFVTKQNVAGYNFTIDVYAVDQWFNTVTDSSTSIAVTTSDTADTEPGANILSGGHQTYIITNRTAGTNGNGGTLDHTIAVAANTAGYARPTSSPYTVLHDVAHHLTYSTQPSVQAIPSQTFYTMPVVKVYDIYNNLVLTDGADVYSVNHGPFTLTLDPKSASSCASAGPGAFASNTAISSAGVATFSGVNASTAGTFYVKASSGTLVLACSSAVQTVSPPPTLSPNPTTTVATGKSKTFILTNGVPPVTLALVTNNSGAPAPGTTVYTAGATVGAVDTVRAVDFRGNFSPTTNITVMPTLTISPTATTVAQTKNRTFTSTGGVGGNVYSVFTNGSGTASFASNVYAAGTNAGPGTKTDSVRVTDTDGNYASATVTVNPNLSASTAAASQFVVMTGRTRQFSGIYGSGAGYTYAVTTKASGSNAAIDATGLYTAGTSAGTYPQTDVVTVTDSDLNTYIFNVTVNPALALTISGSTTMAAHSTATGASPTNFRSFTSAGGVGTYTFDFSTHGTTSTFSGSGNATGGGTSTFVVGNNSSGTDVVRVTDADGNTAVQSLTILAPLTIAMAAGNPSTIVLAANTSNSRTLDVNGGAGGYTFSYPNQPSGGVFPFGTPGTSGPTQAVYHVGATAAGTDRVRVLDTDGNYAIFDIVVYPALSLTTGQSTTIAQKNTAANTSAAATRTFTVVGGASAFTYSVLTNTSGGATFTGSGTTGTYTVGNSATGTDTIKVVDSQLNYATFNMTVVAPLTMTLDATPATLPAQVAASANVSNKRYLTVAGGIGTVSAYTYNFATTAPTGSTFVYNAGKGEFTVGSAAGTANVRVSDGENSIYIPITVNAPLAVTTSSSTVGAWNSNGSAPTRTLTGSGGVGTLAYTLTANPSGATIIGATYTVGTSAGTDVVTVTDQQGNTSTLTLTVNSPLTMTLTGASTIAAGANVSGTRAFSASGGRGTLTYTRVNALTGSSVSPTTGASTTYTVGTGTGAENIRVTDLDGSTATILLTVSPAMVFSNATVAYDSVNALSATGGVGALTYALQAGSGSITGGTNYTAPNVGGVTGTVRATDTQGNYKDAVYTITGANLVISPTSFNYGTLNADQSQTFTITNTGSASGGSSVISVTLTEPATETKYTNTVGCNGTLAGGGASCTFSVTFRGTTNSPGGTVVGGGTQYDGTISVSRTNTTQTAPSATVTGVDSAP